MTQERLHPLFQAERRPDHPAQHFVHADGSLTTLSYAELADAILRGAQLLRRLGLRRGDGLVVLSENRPEVLPLYWAAQLAGLWYTPVSVQFGHAEIGHILRDCDARLLIISATQEAKLASTHFPQEIVYSLDAGRQWPHWSKALQGEPTSWIADASEGAEMLYSSGSSGLPKGVCQTPPGGPPGVVTDFLRQRMARHAVDADMRYLSTQPLYHSAPLRYNVMAHRVGATALVMARFEPRLTLNLLEQHRITHSQWVPTMFVRLLRLPEAERLGWNFQDHRFALHAAAPCPIAVKAAMLDWWGPILHEFYSGTEGNGQTTISPEEWRQRPGSVGRPIQGRIHIVDEQGNPLPAGETGLVYFEGGPAFSYYKDPAKTAASRHPAGWTTLGDIGHVDEAGYLYLSGRAGQVINSGGLKVYPAEVENCLLEHSAVQDAAVIPAPDPEFGQRVRALVVPAEGISADEVLVARLQAHCRARLAHFKCPRQIEFRAELPRHETGKLYHRLIE